MTSIEQIADRFENPSLKRLFIKYFKKTVLILKGEGLDNTESNRLAFDMLITDGGFETILVKSFTTLN